MVSYDDSYKFAVIGDSGVGKSQIIRRYTKNQFDEKSKTTIGIEFGSRIVTLGSNRVQLQLWDTAGQERFRSLPKAYYRGAAAGVLVYDITNHLSFRNLKEWLSELKYNCDDESMPCLLIGNKLDIRHLRAVPTEEAEIFASNNKLLFYETSALDSTNIEVALNGLLMVTRKNQGNKIPSNTSGTIISNLPPAISRNNTDLHSKCC